MFTTVWLSSTSQSPSEPMTRNLCFCVSSMRCTTSGAEVHPTEAATASPMDRVTISPGESMSCSHNRSLPTGPPVLFLRCCTRPPASRHRFRSSARAGRWSRLRGSAVICLASASHVPMTTRESPAVATNSCGPHTNATEAVEPLSEQSIGDMFTSASVWVNAATSAWRVSSLSIVAMALGEASLSWPALVSLSRRDSTAGVFCWQNTETLRPRVPWPSHTPNKLHPLGVTPWLSANSSCTQKMSWFSRFSGPYPMWVTPAPRTCTTEGTLTRVEGRLSSGILPSVTVSSCFPFVPVGF
mmetsp:Transcript_30568/g.58892  ORF Transcript_30568/g.58892 Transcript_30568/m.58892 type:complete len:299 (-) Transcript_30568:544-1440(-)